MEQFKRYFVHMPEYRVVICKECGVAPVPEYFAGHLKNEKHRRLPRSVRDEMIRSISSIEGLAATADDIVYPEPTSDPIPYLPVLPKMLKCMARKPDGSVCGCFRSTRQDMQAHCRKDHRWVNPRKRGRAPRSGEPDPNQLWVENVQCQQFGKTGGFQRLFEVNASKQRNAGDSDDDNTIERRLEGVFERAATAVELADKKANSGVRDQHRISTRNFVKRAGWDRHLRGFDRKWLLHTMREPDGKEKALEQLRLSVKTVIWMAQRASRPEVVGLAALNYVDRREVGAESNERPFNAGQMAKTMIKYSTLWADWMSYIWRTHTLEEAWRDEEEDEEQEDEEGDGNESDGEEGNIKGMRPSYRLTAEQQEKLDAIKEVIGEVERSEGDEGEDGEEEEGDEGSDVLTADEERELDRRTLSFLISLLDHQLGDNDFRSALVSALAITGLHEDRGWKGPSEYTGNLSGFVTVSKMLVLLEAKTKRSESIERMMSQEGLNKAVAEERAPEHFDFVKEMVHGFMTLTTFGGRPTPMNFVLQLCAFGRKIHNDTNADGVGYWNGDELVVGYSQFTMVKLRAMIHGLVQTARIHLLEKLLLLRVDDEGQVIKGTTPLPPVDWGSLFDNPAELKLGWSFLKDPRNKFGGINGEEWLSKRIVQEQRLREEFIDSRAVGAPTRSKDSMTLKRKRVEQYGRAMRVFRSYLSVLGHMSGGQPPRGKELMTIEYKNSVESEIRGAFIEDGLLVLVVVYHKGMSSSRKVKMIHRYLPQEVGELFLYYLWLAVPGWRRMVSIVSEGKSSWTSAYIWEPVKEGRWAHPRAAKRRRLGRDGMAAGEGGAEGGAEEEEGGGEKRRREVERSRRGPFEPEQWDTNRLTRAIRRASLTWMQTKLTVASWRHATKLIYRKYMESAARLLVRIDDDQEAEEGNEAFDLQTGHTTKVAGGIYGRLITESPFTTQLDRARSRRVSLEWHRFLMFKSTLAQQTEGSRKIEKEAREDEWRRWRLLRAVDVQQQLELMVGKGAQFRGVQREALEAIMGQKSPVVAIMGTGGGKSLLFMLPAACSTGLTVVVVPLISLRGNMKDRCDEMGIECVEWESRRPHEWAQIVLVTPEAAVSEAFGNFITRQRMMGRLDRIVVDECHVVLDSVKSWRVKMLGVRKLITMETQTVYLTATLRPRDEVEFSRLMGLPEDKEGCHWFRGRTTRRNVRYEVRLYDKKEEMEVVRQLVEEKKQQYPLPGQIVIYCETVDLARDLAKDLDCECYHREVGDTEEKKAIVRRLCEGEEQVFTATNALGLGVDAPSIRVVIHVGVVRKLRDYAQESGRAGRDGLKSEAIILHRARYDRAGRFRGLGLHGDVEEEMGEFIGAEGCMRVVLDRAMDGRKDRTRCEEGEEKCYRCRARDEEMVGEGEDELREVAGNRGTVEEDELREVVEMEQERRRRQRLAVEERKVECEEVLEVEELEEGLEIWGRGCQWCRVMGKGETECGGHEISGCREMGAEQIREGLERMTDWIRWEKFSCCFECGTPQEICEGWELKEDGSGWRRVKGVSCQFSGVLIGTMVALFGRWPGEMGDWIGRRMGQEGYSIEECRDWGTVMGWMCGKVRWGGVESNEMCRVFVGVLRELREDGMWEGG